jgi:hypothetical protein
MVRQEFILHETEDEVAHYDSDNMKCVFNLNHCYTYRDIVEAIEHEILHHCFHLVQGDSDWDSDKDHWIMQRLWLV